MKIALAVVAAVVAWWAYNWFREPILNERSRQDAADHYAARGFRP